jgi:hypothetical protein
VFSKIQNIFTKVRSIYTMNTIMPAKSSRQKHFFGLVRAVQKGEKSPNEVSPAVRKAASTITAKDASDFASSKVEELKVKKAVLGILRDIKEPMPLQEDANNAVTTEFNVEGKFEEYVRRFMGQRLLDKELEAVNTFQDVKPTKISSNEIRYESTDSFKNSTVTIIKKLKEGGSFVFTAFTKYSKAEKPENQQQPQGGMGGPMGGPMGGGLGGPSPMFENKGYISWPEPVREAFGADPLSGAQPAGVMPPQSPMASQPSVGPMTSTAPMTGTLKTPEQEKKEKGIDDILVRKSLSFNDEIKGGGILIDFLKKLDL